jgi:hypothetical protein
LSAENMLVPEIHTCGGHRIADPPRLAVWERVGAHLLEDKYVHDRLGIPIAAGEEADRRRRQPRPTTATRRRRHGDASRADACAWYGKTRTSI